MTIREMTPEDAKMAHALMRKRWYARYENSLRYLEDEK